MKDCCRWLKIALNYFAFYLIWIVCIWAALKGVSSIALPLISLYFVFHIMYISPSPLCELYVIGIVTLLGIANDIFLSRFGFVQYASPLVLGTTGWTMALWACFGTTYWHSLVWLERYVWLSPLLGAFSVSICYAIVERSTAVTFLVSKSEALLVIASLWAILYPVSLVISRSLRRKIQGAQR